MLRILLTGFVFSAFAASSALAADSATVLGVFKNWETYTSGSGTEMSCFAISKPRAQEPRNTKRSPALIVTDWPGRKVKAEPEIVPGYAYKAGAPIFLEIGGDKFTFFPRNQGPSGSAWLQSLKDGDALLDALNRGVSAVAIGTPSRGAKTVDTYSLAGFPEALAKIHAACNMG
jgi:hypothetical protein